VNHSRIAVLEHNPPPGFYFLCIGAAPERLQDGLFFRPRSTFLGRFIARFSVARSSNYPRFSTAAVSRNVISKSRFGQTLVHEYSQFEKPDRCSFSFVTRRVLIESS
jgi:hypothetical protein